MNSLKNNSLPRGKLLSQMYILASNEPVSSLPLNKWNNDLHCENTDLDLLKLCKDICAYFSDNTGIELIQYKKLY